MFCIILRLMVRWRWKWVCFYFYDSVKMLMIVCLGYVCEEVGFLFGYILCSIKVVNVYCIFYRLIISCYLILCE